MSASSSAPTSTDSRPAPSITLAALALAGLGFALLQSLVAPALPVIQRELDASPTSATWVLTAFLLSAAVSTPILGRLGDVHGKRLMLLVSIGGLGLGALIAALAPSIWLLVLGRVIQGLGGGIFPLAFGVIRDEFPRSRVPGSIGLMSALIGLGAGLGVVLSGVIVDNLDYRFIFWMPLAAIAVGFFAAWRFVPDSPVRARVPINWLGAALMSTGLAAVLLALSETGSWGWGSPRTLGLLVAGAAVLAAWVRSELRSETPLVDMRLMAVRGVWTVNLVGLLIGGGMFTGFILIPQLVQLPPETAGIGFGASVTEAGLFLLPMSLAMLFVGTAAGRLERRFGSKPPVLGGVGFALLGFVLLLTAHDDKLPIYVASGLLGVGLGLAFAAMANLIVQAVPPEQTGVATGMNTVARSVGGAFGSQLGATFLAGSVGAAGLPSADGFDAAFRVAIIALLLALAAGIAIPGSAERARERAVGVPEPSRA